MRSDKNKNADDETSELSSIGTLIRLAREEKKLSQKELAGKLNLDLQLISNLENDQFDTLPAPAFVRGYIRACAKLLEQDSKQWLDIYLLTTRSNDPKLAPLASFNLKKTDSSHPFFRSITILVITILVALASYWWFTEKGGSSLFYSETKTEIHAEPAIVTLPQASTAPAEEVSEQASKQADTTPPAQETEPVLPLSKKATTTINKSGLTTNSQNSTILTEKTIPTTAVESLNTLSVTEKDIGKNIKTDPETAPETDPDQIPPPLASTGQSNQSNEEIETVTPVQNEVTGSDNMVLKTSTKSWVEVYDDNGHRLIFDMQTSANERQLRGQAPFRVFLGDATGMTITINGRDIGEISHHKTTKTARFYIDSDGTIRK